MAKIQICEKLESAEIEYKIVNMFSDSYQRKKRDLAAAVKITSENILDRYYDIDQVWDIYLINSY